MIRLLRAALRREGGQSLVEFSLVSIVFFLLVFGTIDVGRAVWNYNTLAQATREGTRYAIVHGADSSDPSGPGSAYYTPPNIDTNVTQVVEANAAGLNTTQLTVEAHWWNGTNSNGDPVSVETHYTYQPIFNFLGILSFTMSSSSRMDITN